MPHERLIGMSGKSSIKVSTNPPGTEIPRFVLILVLAGVVIVVLFAVIPFIQTLLKPATNVTISNISPRTSGCLSGQPQYYTYTWTFTLTNTGGTNANATVSIVALSAQYSGASPLKSQVFSVPKGGQTQGTMSITLQSLGCRLLSTTTDLTIQITNTIRT